ncbi:MAG: DUF1501 domain-containing protein, partial [Candidatus Obscuribacterales bacterium]|nr:DUF1501 domain-containing protein [Candidatus Obscuribacterales bacterium]
MAEIILIEYYTKMYGENFYSRRDALKMAAFVALTGIGGFNDSAFGLGSSGAPRVLLQVHLKGGNDALNTIVPYRSERYYRDRPGLAIEPNMVLPMTGTLGFNPALSLIADRYRAGNVAVLLGTGIPEQTKSHWRASQILFSGNNSGIGMSNWFEVGLQAQNSAIRTKNLALSFDEAEGADKLYHLIDKALDPEFNVLLVRIELEGFDTHFKQKAVHGQNLKVLSELVDGVHRRFDTSCKSFELLSILVSEFGRGIAENEDGGTDHGEAGCCFLIGRSV